MSTRYDVAIVGYGPAGAVLAARLGQSGVKVAVIEREADVYAKPRAAHFDHEIMRIFQSLGVAEDILPSTATLKTYRFVNAGGETLMAFPVGSDETPSGWRQSFMFYQPDAERAVRRAVARQPTVDVFLEHAFEGLEQDAESVSLKVRPLDGGPPKTIDALYAVGCDGASSAVRAALGIGHEDLDFDEPWLVVDVLLNDGVDLGRDGMQYCDPARPVTKVPMSPGRFRWEFMLLPGETREEMLKPERIWQLLEPWIAPHEGTLARSAVYRFHALIAAPWRDRRVLLAGDAAHQMPPFMGQGLCSGVRDADALAWRFDLVLSGAADQSLLDSYEEERGPHVRTIIETAIFMGRVICTLDPSEAAKRDAEMLGKDADDPQDGASPIPPLKGSLIDPETGGELFLQGRIESEGDVLRFDDWAGPGFQLVSLAPVRFGADAAAFWTRIGGRTTVLGNDAIDADGRLTGWLERRGGAVLARPDHYVFASGGDPGDLVSKLQQAMAPHLADRPAAESEKVPA